MSEETRRSWCKHLVGFAAPKFAQHRYGAKSRCFDDLWSHDDLIIDRVLAAISSSPADKGRLLAAIEDEAREFVDAHWTAIERLANVLFEREKLNRDEIAAVLDRA